MPARALTGREAVSERKWGCFDVEKRRLRRTTAWQRQEGSNRSADSWTRDLTDAKNCKRILTTNSVGCKRKASMSSLLVKFILRREPVFEGFLLGRRRGPA
jgi:hypothetical protein